MTRNFKIREELADVLKIFLVVWSMNLIGLFTFGAGVKMLGYELRLELAAIEISLPAKGGRQ